MTKRFGPMLLCVLLLSTSAYARIVTLGAVLTGAHEVPPTGLNAFGNATVLIDTDLVRADVTVDVSGLGSPIVGAHIHEGAAGVNGPVVLNFLAGTNAFNFNRFNAQFALTPEFMNRILANPSNFYVNVHTTQFPNGAVRGQLTNNDAQTHFAGELRGSNEVPPTTVTTVGAFHVSFDDANNMTFEVNYGDLTPAPPSAAHIHRGANTVAGPVVIGLTTATINFDNGRLRGTIPVSDAALVADIKANPQNYYVNVHTTQFPGGAIRGQLFPAEEFDIAVAGRVTNSLGQTFVTDVRIFNPSYDNAVAALLEYFTGNTNNTLATASKAVNIPPRGTAILDDVNGTSGFNVTGVGAIRITSQEHLAVTSRIYADLRASNRGTFGQFVPSAEAGQRLRRGVLPQLSNRAFDGNNPSGYRTNIGFFNPNTVPVSARLELRLADGTQIGQADLTLGSLSHQQNAITGYFPGVDLSDRADLTLSFDASAPIVAYASVVDNVSADQIFVVAQDDPGVSTAP